MPLRILQIARTLNSFSTTSMRSATLMGHRSYTHRSAFHHFRNCLPALQGIISPPQPIIKHSQPSSQAVHTSASDKANTGSKRNDATHEANFKHRDHIYGRADHYYLNLPRGLSKEEYDDRIKAIKNLIDRALQQQSSGHAQSSEDKKAAASPRGDDIGSMTTLEADDLARRGRPRIVGSYVIPDVLADISLAGFTPKYEYLLQELDALEDVKGPFPQGLVHTAELSSLYETNDSSCSHSTSSISAKAQGWPLQQVVTVPAASPACKDLYAYVIDTAVNPDHSDLKGVVVEQGRDCLSPGSDLDEAGSDVQSTSEYGMTHGTKVASLLAGKRGLAKGAIIVSVRAIRGGGRPSHFEELKRALSFVKEDIESKGRRGKAVVNMSLAGPAPDPSLMDARDKANHDEIIEHFEALAKLDTLCIVAAGNHGHDASHYWPAQLSQVLTVGAIGEVNDEWMFSNTGSAVNLMAPGIDIPFDSGTDKGTSLAAPIVAGLALGVIAANAANASMTVTVSQLRLALEAMAMKNMLVLRKPSANLRANFDQATLSVMLDVPRHGG